MVKLWTIDDFCEYTGQRKQTVYGNIHEGRYPFEIMKMGNRLRFRLDDIEKWEADGFPYLPVRKLRDDGNTI